MVILRADGSGIHDPGDRTTHENQRRKAAELNAIAPSAKEVPQTKRHFLLLQPERHFA